MEKILVIHHGNCQDGFAGAYAAWKKFGDQAEYVAAAHGGTPPNVAGREVYMIDFSYPKEVLLGLESKATRFVVLDHHMGARESVEAVKEHVFDNDHSGAAIAWAYFHPGAPLPRLLAYIEDNDLWRHSLPRGKEVAAYLGTVSFDFKAFDALATKVETEEGFLDIVRKGAAYAEYFDHVCTEFVASAQKITIDEFTVLSVNAPRLFRSEVGHRLANIQAPFGVVWSARDGVWHFSLRGDGSVDVSEIARRRGGNGHHDAAAFLMPFSEPFPFILS